MNDFTSDRQAHQAQVIQFQARNELHRHFSGDYRPRKPTAKRIAKRASVVALVMVAVFVYFRFQLWGIYTP